MNFREQLEILGAGLHLAECANSTLDDAWENLEDLEWAATLIGRVCTHKEIEELFWKLGTYLMKRRRCPAAVIGYGALSKCLATYGTFCVDPVLGARFKRLARDAFDLAVEINASIINDICELRVGDVADQEIQAHAIYSSEAALDKKEVCNMVKITAPPVDVLRRRIEFIVGSHDNR